MRFSISAHAKIRLARRGIPESLLKNVLQAPDQRVPGRRGRAIYQSVVALRGRQFILRAIVEERTELGIVVSVYYSDRIDKYWKPEGTDE